MILSFINIRKVPREMLKTSGFALGFQHLPRDLANVNEWKIMFDPYIEPQVFVVKKLLQPAVEVFVKWTSPFFLIGHLKGFQLFFNKVPKMGC